MIVHIGRSLFTTLVLAWGMVLNGFGQEIIPSHPPRLSREQVYQLEISGTVPDTYWARTMTPGETRIIDGVIHRKLSVAVPRIGRLPDAQAEALGVPRDALSASIMGVDSFANKTRLLQRAAVAGWLVKREHGRLPLPLQDTLYRRFQAVTVEAGVIQRAVSEGRMGPEEGQRRMAALLAGVLLEENEVYRMAPPSFRQRYGMSMDSVHLLPSRSDLERDLLPFITGALLTRRLPDSGKSVPPVKRHRPRDTIRGYRSIPAPGMTIETIEYEESPTEYAAIEGRIFVAEHPVVASWQWGIVHSSIVAGIWILAIERRIVETREVPLALLTRSPEERRANDGQPAGKLISRTRQTTTTWKFYDWVWANGCLGSYGAADDLQLKERVSGEPVNDIGLLMQLLCSYIPESATEPCLNRATSYSLGLYGVNYVCHQTANAFMRTRRGYEPVVHWYSLLAYGMSGSSGTSTCVNSGGYPMRGCIPGNWCEGNHFPYIKPFLEPVSAWIEEGAVGDGYGLSVVWHPAFGWIMSQAVYNDHPVPIQPGDDPPTTVVEILPLE